MQNARQHARELGILDWVWSHDVHRAADLLVGKRGSQDPDHIIKRYPGHPLLAASEPAADAQFEWSEHLRQSAALC